MQNAIQEWLFDRRNTCGIACRPIETARAESWHFDRGRLQHVSGRFFSIVGVKAVSSDPRLHDREYLMIDQPEIGILGLLFFRDGDEQKVIMQAKAEPGNVSGIQLAPTVQATESNYLRVHGGRSTAYLDIFTKRTPGVSKLADSLQSEQGSRFIGKYNRNLSLLSEQQPDAVSASFKCCSMSEVLDLLDSDFAINTDARSVLACGDWEALAWPHKPFHGDGIPNDFQEALRTSLEAPDQSESAIEFLGSRREQVSTMLREVDLHSMTQWEVQPGGLRHGGNGGVDMAMFEVVAPDREVERWDQPLICDPDEQIAILVCQNRSGVLQFLLSARPEIGFREVIQFGPTVQTGLRVGDDPALLELLMSHPDVVVRASIMQTDEGGRFYRCITRYEILEAPEGILVPVDQEQRWVNLRTIRELLRSRGMLTNEARTLVSLLLKYL